MNQLPKESHEQKLERRSIDKLRLLFHENDMFIVRSERPFDYGVDCDIEIKDTNGSPTNINFHAQVKAIDKLEKKAKNNDGSYSIQISISNVNYLLNSLKSVYILYVNSEDRFYFFWADEFFLQLYKKDEKWYEKEAKPSIKFRNIIDHDNLENIHKIVLETGKLKRKIGENLIRLTSTTRPISSKIVVDLNKINVQTEQEIIEAIEIVGFRLINEGNSNQLIEVSKSLTKGIEASPIVCLILGFASFNVGQYYDALSYLRKAKIKIDFLKRVDKAYLLFLEAHIKYSIGLISEENFSKAVEEITEIESVKLYHRLMKTKELFKSDPPKWVSETRDLVIELKAHEEEYPAIYLQAKTDLLHAEGWYNNHIGILNIERINAIERVDGINAYLRQESVNELLRLNKSWEELRSQLYDKIVEHGNYLILANYYQIYVLITLRTRITYSLVKVEKKIPGLEIEEQDKKESIESLKHFIDQSIAIYHKFENNYNLCVALATQFELFEFYEMEEEAKQTLDEIFKVANLFDFEDIKEKTDNLQNEGSFYKGLVKELNLKNKKVSELKNREEMALNILREVDEKDVKVRNEESSKKDDEDLMIVDVFKIGFFKIPKERLNDFFEALDIEPNSDVAKQLKFMSFEFEYKLIPRLNISPEKIVEEGYGEGNFSINSIEDLERVAERRKKLFETGFHKQEPYY
jgi:hypothetical protein